MHEEVKIQTSVNKLTRFQRNQEIMIRLSSMKEQKKAEEAAGNQPKSKVSAAQLRIAKVG
jgi:hypothetical protein